jgi:dethiobiotin synthetase
MSLTQNLLWARAAIAYTHKVLPFGVSNPIYGQHTTPEAPTKVLNARVDAQEIGFSTSARTASALGEGAGNCGEMARIALKKLKTLGAGPLHLMHIPVIVVPGVGNINHTFVVIEGQNLNGTPCTGWGANAVICDPWISVAAQASLAHNTWAPYGQNAWPFAEETTAGNLRAPLAESPF